MTSPLLTTKLHIPPVRPNLVARPRLIGKLNEGLARPLTLISAPPGFGKTTLVAAWLDQQPLPVAWLSLDERDNDLARFMAYLVAALETVQPEIGRQALHRLHSRRQSSPESAMTLLANDIAAIPHPFVLVLDDYHLIELQAIHEAMAFLFDHLPAPLHLVIATRADPPFPLARLRARDQLVELRAPDLRFSPEEAIAFLNERMGLQLTPEQVAALDARAEGWIAGLQLAALSIRGHQNVAGFVHAFTGSHRFILDYLAEEVLQHQAPETQTFLLQTCILGQMNASLADAVTGRNDSELVLAQLERANLFVVPLDDARQWYRYHHLFGDLLQSRLLQTQPEQVGELHRRASTWYEQNGFVNEAIDHALEVPDFERAARLIEQAAPALLVRSEDLTLRTWLAAIPSDLNRTHPALDVWNATALAGAGQFELAEACLARVDDSQLDPIARQVSGLMRAATALFRTDLPHAVESAREALIAAETSSGDPTDSQAEFNRIATVWLAMLLGEAQLAAGQLRAALATLSREFELGKSAAFATLYQMGLGYLHMRLADLSYEMNDMSAASQHANQGLEISHAEHNEEFESYALSALAQIRQAQGDPGGALELVSQAMTLGRKRNIANELRLIASRQVKLLVQQNRLDEAAQAAREMQSADTSAWFLQSALTPVAHARVMIAQRESDRAIPALESLEKQLKASGEMRTQIEVLALLALAWRGKGDTAQAMTALARALSLAEPEGYARTFLDLGEPMRLQIADFAHSLESGELQTKGLREIEKDGHMKQLAGYIDKLLAAFPMMHSEELDAQSHGDLWSAIVPNQGIGRNLQSQRNASQSAMVPEPLSERELAVLRLIAEGLSNQEIADRLVIAVSTVKTHINNIYGKLGVGSRTQALVRADELKLL